MASPKPLALPASLAPGFRSSDGFPSDSLAVGCQVSYMSEPSFTPMVSAISPPTNISRGASG